MLLSDELFEIRSARKVAVAVPRPRGKRVNQGGTILDSAQARVTCRSAASTTFSCLMDG